VGAVKASDFGYSLEGKNFGFVYFEELEVPFHLKCL
jgi:hypothetical protein